MNCTRVCMCVCVCVSVSVCVFICVVNRGYIRLRLCCHIICK